MQFTIYAFQNSSAGVFMKIFAFLHKSSKANIISLVLRTFFVLFLSCSHCYEGAWKSLQGRGKSTFPSSLMTFPPTLKTFPGTFIAVRTAQNSTQKVCRTRENSLLCSYCNRREKFNFPPLFPLQSQCIPVIHGFYLECLASLDIQTEAIHDRKTLTFWGKSGGKQNFSLLLKYSQRK